MNYENHNIFSVGTIFNTLAVYKTVITVKVQKKFC